VCPSGAFNVIEGRIQPIKEPKIRGGAMELDRRSLLQAMSAGAALAPLLSLVPASASENGPSSQDAAAAKQDAGGAKIVQMDPNVSFAKQIEHNVAPVVLLSTFLVRPEYVDDFLSGFQKQFAIMRKQPGLISAQLHRGRAFSLASHLLQS
jgi:hypothetical protein